MIDTDDEQWNQLHADQAFMVDAIIRARERYGLDQGWVAEQAGYSLTQYIRIENRERQITYMDALRIGGVIADYSYSLDPPLKRILRNVKATIKWHLYDLQLFLERTIPGGERIFENTSLREYIGSIYTTTVLICYCLFGPPREMAGDVVQLVKEFWEFIQG